VIANSVISSFLLIITAVLSSTLITIPSFRLQNFFSLTINPHITFLWTEIRGMNRVIKSDTLSSRPIVKTRTIVFWFNWISSTKGR
jgi:hypothetical protein